MPTTTKPDGLKRKAERAIADDLARSPQYVDTKAAAKVADLSPDTFVAWRSVGYGPPYSRLGRRVVYSVADVIAFIEARKVGKVE